MNTKKQAIQVVPDFLATKYNFSDSGILIKTNIIDSKDESENDIKIGIVTVSDTVTALKKLLSLTKNKTTC